MDILKEIVRNILAYYILLSIAMSLIGNSKFKKYIELFTGIILILIILTPLFKVLKLNGRLEYNMKKAQLYELTQQDSETIMAAELTESQIITKQYKESIINQIKEELNKNNLYTQDIQIEMEDSLTSEHYGKICSVHIVCNKDLPPEEGKDNSCIQTIHLPNIKISEKLNNKKNTQQSIKTVFETEEAKKNLSRKYNLSASKIIIELKENS